MGQRGVLAFAASAAPALTERHPARPPSNRVVLGAHPLASLPRPCRAWEPCPRGLPGRCRGPPPSVAALPVTRPPADGGPTGRRRPDAAGGRQGGAPSGPVRLTPIAQV